MSKIFLTFSAAQRTVLGDNRTRAIGSMLAYSQVEEALANAFSILPEAMGAFRGRINHLRRLGLVPSSPGKGQRISYDREHIYKWAIGLELAEFGVDPGLIKFIIEKFVWRLTRNYLIGDSQLADKLLVFYPNMLSGLGQYGQKRIVGGFVCDVVDNLRDIDRFRESSQGRLDHELMSGRLGMINLGRLRRAVENGLKAD
jgi:hypothetical protein